MVVYGSQVLLPLQMLWVLGLYSTVPGVKGAPCYKQMADIAFLLDSSVSIHEDDFIKELQFVKHIVKPLPIGRQGIQVSVSTFSTETVTNIYLDDFDNKQDIMGAIDNIKYRGGQTNTDIAIAHARESIFRKQNGDRDGVERLIIVVTDGYSTNNISTIKEAEKCQDMRIKMISVGVGFGIDVMELRNIASKYNGEKLVFTVDDFNGLDDIVDQVTMAACDVMLQDSDSTADTYCGGKPADIYIAVDSSSSMLDIDYEHVLRYLTSVVDMFDLGPDNTRVGVVAYSDHVHPILRLDTTYQRSFINDRIMDIPIYGGRTKTGSVLHYLRRNAFKRDYLRSKVAHVVILVTDGQSNDAERALREAELLRKLGVYIFVIGTESSVDLSELRNIASQPEEKFLFQKEDIRMMSAIRELLAITPCNDADATMAPEIQLDNNSNQGNQLCPDSQHRYTLFVYNDLLFSQKTNNIIQDFVDKLINKRTGTTLEYDWMTTSRVESKNRNTSQNEALAFLLKYIRIHGVGGSDLTQKARRRTLVLFINNSLQNGSSKLINELRRLNFIFKANIVLISIGNDNIHTQFDVNGARIINISTINHLHQIKQTLVSEICTV